jgi:hypothetical protein
MTWHLRNRIGLGALVATVLLVTLATYFLLSGLIAAKQARISIIQASYGSSCASVPARLPGVNHYRVGNVTRIVKEYCRNSLDCEMLVDPSRFGDPVSGCGKDLEVSFKCGPSDTIHQAYVTPEAAGKMLHINCGPMINILEASYGANCANVEVPPPGANSFRTGNATTVTQQACTGSPSCRLPIEATQLGDPVSGCSKDFKATYTCGTQDVKEVYLAGEAHGKTVEIDCSKDN